MPIRDEMRARYPANWPEIRARILERASHRCERCGLPNYAVGYRDERGRFQPNGGNGPCDASGQGRTWPSLDPLTHAEARQFVEEYNCCEDGRDELGYRWFAVVLTVAHVENRAPEDCREENLQALCQQCHLRLDAREHAETAAETRRRKRLQVQPELALEVAA